MCLEHYTSCRIVEMSSNQVVLPSLPDLLMPASNLRACFAHMSSSLLSAFRVQDAMVLHLL